MSKLSMMNNLSEKTGIILLFAYVFVLAYAVMNPSLIGYYFDTIVGRLILVVFILAICSCSSLVALLTLLILIYLSNNNITEGFKSENGVVGDKKNTVKNSISSVDGTNPAPVGGFIIEQVNTVPQVIATKPKPKRKRRDNTNTRESMLNVEETLRSKESKKMFIHNSAPTQEPRSYDPVNNSGIFAGK